MSTVTFPWQHKGLHSKGKIRVFLPQDVLNIFKFAFNCSFKRLEIIISKKHVCVICKWIEAYL